MKNLTIEMVEEILDTGDLLMMKLRKFREFRKHQIFTII
jgi:hypothetical protein